MLWARRWKYNDLRDKKFGPENQKVLLASNNLERNCMNNSSSHFDCLVFVNFRITVQCIHRISFQGRKNIV